MRSRDKGWPMPPPAPRTVTLDWRAAEEENWRAWDERERVAARKNMADVLVVNSRLESGGGGWGGGGRGRGVVRNMRRVHAAFLRVPGAASEQVGTPAYPGLRALPIHSHPLASNGHKLLV